MATITISQIVPDVIIHGCFSFDTKYAICIDKYIKKSVTAFIREKRGLIDFSSRGLFPILSIVKQRAGVIAKRLIADTANCFSESCVLA